MTTDFLPPELSQFVKTEVACGHFVSAEAVMIEGVQLLRERKEKFERLRADLQAARDQFDRGEYSEYDQEGLRALFKEIKREGRRDYEAHQNSR